MDPTRPTAAAPEMVSRNVGRIRVGTRLQHQPIGPKESLPVAVTWLLLVFVIAFRPQEIWDSLSGMRLAMMTKLALLAALVLSGYRWRYRVPQFYAYAGMVAAIGLSGLSSYLPGLAATGLIIGTRELFFFVVAISAVRSLRLVRRSLWLWLVCYGVSCVWAQITQGHLDRVGGISADTGGTSDFGIVMTMCAGMTIGLIPYYKGFLLRAILSGGLCVFIWGLIRTGSRGSFLGFIVMIGFWFFCDIRGLAKRIAIAIAALVVAAAIIVPTGRLSRQATIADWQEDDSASIRIDLNIAAIKMWADNPLTGVGLGCFPLGWFDYRPKEYAEDTGWGRHWLPCHNMFLTVLAETGLVGFISVLALYYCTCRDLFRLASARNKKAVSAEIQFLAKAMLLAFVGGCAGAMFLRASTVPYHILIILAVALCQAAHTNMRRPVASKSKSLDSGGRVNR